MNRPAYLTARCTRCRNVTGVGGLRMRSPDLLLCSRCMEGLPAETGAEASSAAVREE